MPKTAVVFINGSASSGKDTFVEFCQKYPSKIRVDNLSSIDPIRRAFDVKATDKRPETRRFLAVVGNEAEAYCKFRSKETAFSIWGKLVDFADTPNGFEQQIVFVHVRELSMMTSIMEQIRERVYDMHKHMTFSRLLVRSKTESNIDNNESDREANTAKPKDYHVVIDNYGSLSALQIKAEEFLRDFKWG